MLIIKEYPSSSSDKVYVAKYETSTGHVTCTCRGFRTPNKCWHVRDIVERNGGDAPGRAMAEAGFPNPRPSGYDDGGPQKIAGVASGHSYVEPMLAVQMDKARIADWRDWAIEEKFDGHRVIVMVVASEVTAWSRGGKRRELPARVREAFSTAPNGIYDGELMGAEGGTFADVRRLGGDASKHFVVFDVINHMGDDVRGLTYDERRAILVFRVMPAIRQMHPLPVRLAESRNLESTDDVTKFVEAVWARGGEGAILKRRAARYQAGKRSPDFVKVKKGGSSVGVVTGFEKGTRGPRSVVVVTVDGVATSVKWETKLGAADDSWIGRELRIEYTEIRDGAVVNPRADRWEEE